MGIRLIQENRLLALQPSFYIASMSKLIDITIIYQRIRSDHSFRSKITILGVINRNPRIRIRGWILYISGIPVYNS